MKKILFKLFEAGIASIVTYLIATSLGMTDIVQILTLDTILSVIIMSILPW